MKEFKVSIPENREELIAVGEKIKKTGAVLRKMANCFFEETAKGIVSGLEKAKKNYCESNEVEG